MVIHVDAAANALGGGVDATGPGGPLYSSIPSDTTTTSTIALGTSVYGSLAVGDSDWFRVQLTAGVQYEFRLHGSGVNQLPDPFLNLRDSAGAVVATNDDAGAITWGNDDHDPNLAFQDSRIVFTATTTGVHFLDVGSFQLESAGNFLATAVVHDPVGMNFTVDEIAWQLTNNFAEYNSGGAGAFNIGVDRQLTVNITALTEDGKTMCLNALEQWGDVLGVTFVQTAGAAEITFDDTDPNTAITAYANTSITNGVITSANVILTEGWLGRFGTGFASYSYETYVHEIGHALGLGHGGNYNGSATFGVDNYYRNDSVAFSIMSYMNARDDEFSQDGTGHNTNVDADFRYMQNMSIADIIAMQILYGDNSSTRTGNTIYGFASNTGNAALDGAVTIGADMFMCIYDDGGTDNLNFSGATVAQTINLAAESFSNVLGGVSNLTIARGVVIENATGGSVADTLLGNAAANSLNGRGGADTMTGFTGNDQYFVDNAGDVVVEGASQGTADRVLTSISYTLGAAAQIEVFTTINSAGTAAINLTGNGFAQQIHGNAGVNIIDGKGGADTMTGFAGNDQYFVDVAGDAVVEAAGQGTADRVLASVSYVLGALAQVEILSTTNVAGTGAINLTGNAFAQQILGNAGINVLNGGGAADTMTGFAGNDQYYVDNAGDVVVEGASQGTADRVLASVNYVLTAAAQVELLTTTNTAGTGAINLTGNGFAQTMHGNAGANVLNGGGAADTMTGFAGNDQYFVDNVGDVVVEGAAQGTADRVRTSISYTLGATAQIEQFTTTNMAGTGAINLTGNGFAQTIDGNAGVNVLNGGGGADTMTGFAGNDQYYVDIAGDVVVEGAGQGTTDRVLASVSYVLGAAAQVELFTTTNTAGTGAINLTGNGFIQTMHGNAGSNVLNGGGGSDTMTGFAGSDFFLFNTALGAANIDHITDYNVAQDTIRLENAIFAGLAAGALASGAFNTGAAATEANDRIIYNAATGALLFDANGVGGAAGIQFATISAGLALTSLDFVVV